MRTLFSLSWVIDDLRYVFNRLMMENVRSDVVVVTGIVSSICKAFCNSEHSDFALFINEHTVLIVVTLWSGVADYHCL